MLRSFVHHVGEIGAHCQPKAIASVFHRPALNGDVEVSAQSLPHAIVLDEVAGEVIASGHGSCPPARTIFAGEPDMALSPARVKSAP